MACRPHGGIVADPRKRHEATVGNGRGSSGKRIRHPINERAQGAQSQDLASGECGGCRNDGRLAGVAAWRRP